MTVVAMDFRTAEKAKVSLALGQLWIIWASINMYQAIHGGEQFFRPGIALHSLVGGCGIMGYWHLLWWYSNTVALSIGEYLIIGTFAVLVLSTLISFATGGVGMWKSV